MLLHRQPPRPLVGRRQILGRRRREERIHGR
jgi:hypothetical protein